MPKIFVKIDSQEEKENLKNVRKTLRVLQQTATDKENLAGRPIIDKDAKLADLTENHENKRKKYEDKEVQTGEAIITAADLISDEPSADYWKRLAEKREEMLNDSFKENERLKEHVAALEEENKICKQMLDESKTLVEILQEMLGNEADTTTEEAEEATEHT